MTTTGAILLESGRAPSCHGCQTG